MVGPTALADASSTYTSQLRAQTETGATFVVYRQPIALDRFTVHDVLPPDPAGAAATVAASVKPPHLSRSARNSQRSPGLIVDYGEYLTRVECAPQLTDRPNTNT